FTPCAGEITPPISGRCNAVVGPGKIFPAPGKFDPRRDEGPPIGGPSEGPPIGGPSFVSAGGDSNRGAGPVPKLRKAGRGRRGAPHRACKGGAPPRPRLPDRRGTRPGPPRRRAG